VIWEALFDSLKRDRALNALFQSLCRHTVDGSIHFICMDWRHMAEMHDAVEGTYSELKNLVAWAKDNGGMGTFYRPRHELIFTSKNGTAPYLNNFELGQHGRYRTNVWKYKGTNTFKAGRHEELALHPLVSLVNSAHLNPMIHYCYLINLNTKIIAKL
jgi:hypothetical protein